MLGQHRPQLGQGDFCDNVCLPALDPETGDVIAVIETPKGSPNKYDYDDGCAAFRLAGVMPEGSSFPYDFGFIPSTLGEDGDPLDVPSDT
jgi:inorganic pyrophosphatase